MTTKDWTHDDMAVLGAVVMAGSEQPLTASQIGVRTGLTHIAVTRALRRQLGIKGNLYRRRLILPNSRGVRCLQWGYFAERVQQPIEAKPKPTKTKTKTKTRGVNRWKSRMVRPGDGRAYVMFDTRYWHHPDLAKHVYHRVLILPNEEKDMELLIQVHRNKPYLKASPITLTKKA